MEDKILKAADDIAAVFGDTTEWLDPKREAVVKILKELVEGVQKTQATNIQSMQFHTGYGDGNYNGFGV